jgi:hypothetical protein
MNWYRLYDGTEIADVASPFGAGTIYRYGRNSFRVSVTGGSSMADAHVDCLADAVCFVGHPFRVTHPADYWNGSAIIGAL